MPCPNRKGDELSLTGHCEAVKCLAMDSNELLNPGNYI
jgi:hypothetical protein